MTEAFNEDNTEYGEERLYDFLLRVHPAPAQDVLKGLLSELAAFRGAALQSDDITAVVVRT